jgi:hypothetical protein
LQEAGLHGSDGIEQLVEVLIIEGFVEGTGYPIEKGDDIVISSEPERDLEVSQEPVGIVLLFFFAMASTEAGVVGCEEGESLRIDFGAAALACCSDMALCASLFMSSMKPLCEKSWSSIFV